MGGAAELRDGEGLRLRGDTGPDLVLGRAVARGEVRPETLRPRVATVAFVLLRNEYLTRGIAGVPGAVLVEIVDEVYLPLVLSQ